MIGSVTIEHVQKHDEHHCGGLPTLSDCVVPSARSNGCVSTYRQIAIADGTPRESRKRAALVALLGAPGLLGLPLVVAVVTLGPVVGVGTGSGVQAGSHGPLLDRMEVAPAAG